MARYEKYLTASDVGVWYEQNPMVRPPFLLSSKFEPRHKLSRKVDWANMSAKMPELLSLAGNNTDAIALERGELTLSTAKMPYFKNRFDIDEDDIDLFKMIDESNNAALSELLARVYDDASHLIENAEMTQEAINAQVFTTGALSLASNGQSYKYDYKIPTNHKVEAGVKWDTATADPIADIAAWRQILRTERGADVNEIYMNSTTLGYFSKITAVKNAIYVFANGTVTPSQNAVIDFIEGQTGLRVFVYDRGYANAEHKFVPFIADGTVVLAPNGYVGKGWSAETPEESDAQDVYTVGHGIALTTWRQQDPVAKYLQASMLYLPSFERKDDVIIASVKTAV